MLLYLDENPFINYILRRIRANKNCLIVVVGDTGSGKSYGAIRICELLDKKFNIDRICFTAKKFMELAKDPKIKPGSCLLLDEAGISLDNYTWWSQHERMLNWLFQTFRKKRLITIITVPRLSFIQKKSLSLFHIILETTGIDTGKNLCHMKPKIVVSNPMSLSGDVDFWQRFPTIKDKKGEVIKITKLLIEKPSKELIKQYEKEKTKYMNDLYNDGYIALGGDGIKSSQNIAEQLSRREEQIKKLLDDNPSITNKAICDKLEMSSANVGQYMRRLRNKKVI